MIEDRKLKAGTKLVARHKGREHRAEVVPGEQGEVRYRLANGREFKTPSGAGSAVMGGMACNGWRFWSVARTEEKKPARSTRKKGTRSARSLANTRTQRTVRVQRNGHTRAVR